MPNQSLEARMPMSCGMNFMPPCSQVRVCARFNRWRKPLMVFVRLVLSLVHFQQRPQDSDAMVFRHHTLSVFKLA